MPRESKFRAWNKETKKMCDTLTLQQQMYHEYRSGYLAGGLKMAIKDYFEAEDCAKVYDHLIFMQYTGKKDDNNIEIYEEDIIKGYIERDMRIGIVIYREEFAIYQVKCGERCYNLGSMGILKVLGNKFENKELLEKVG